MLTSISPEHGQTNVPVNKVIEIKLSAVDPGSLKSGSIALIPQDAHGRPENVIINYLGLVDGSHVVQVVPSVTMRKSTTYRVVFSGLTSGGNILQVPDVYFQTGVQVELDSTVVTDPWPTYGTPYDLGSLDVVPTPVYRQVSKSLIVRPIHRSPVVKTKGILVWEDESIVVKNTDTEYWAVEVYFTGELSGLDVTKVYASVDSFDFAHTGVPTYKSECFHVFTEDTKAVFYFTKATLAYYPTALQRYFTVINTAFQQGVHFNINLNPGFSVGGVEVIEPLAIEYTTEIFPIYATLAEAKVKCGPFWTRSGHTDESGIELLVNLSAFIVSHYVTNYEKVPTYFCNNMRQWVIASFAYYVISEVIAVEYMGEGMEMTLGDFKTARGGRAGGASQRFMNDLMERLRLEIDGSWFALFGSIGAAVVYFQPSTSLRRLYAVDSWKKLGIPLMDPRRINIKREVITLEGRTIIMGGLFGISALPPIWRGISWVFEHFSSFEIGSLSARLLDGTRVTPVTVSVDEFNVVRLNIENTKNLTGNFQVLEVKAGNDTLISCPVYIYNA